MITLKDGRKLFYASAKKVEEELLFIQQKDNSKLDGIVDGSSDLEAGIYEGGLKVWECAIDLCNFLCNCELAGLHVLELGCGAALPSILTLQKGAASVCVQDFNDFVIDAFTKLNFELNGAEMAKSAFIAGEWGRTMVEEIAPKKFNLILASETIYNESNYKPFHDTLDALLDSDGKVLLAAKCYYFGVGGSIDSFKQFVLSQRTFAAVEEVWSTKSAPIPRKILSLSRR